MSIDEIITRNLTKYVSNQSQCIHVVTTCIDCAIVHMSNQQPAAFKYVQVEFPILCRVSCSVECRETNNEHETETQEFKASILR